MDEYIEFIDNLIESKDENNFKIEKEAEEFTKRINKNVKDYEAYISRGNIYMKNNLEEKAIDDFTKALKYTNNLNIYLYRCDAYRKLGNYKKALEDCELIIKNKPNNYLGYLKRANIHIEEGKYKKAVDDYTKAMKHNPENKILYKNRAIAYKNLNMEKEYKNDLELYVKLSRTSKEK